MLSDLARNLIEAARNAEQNSQPARAIVHVHAAPAQAPWEKAVETGEYENIVNAMADAYMAAKERKLKALKGLAD